MAYRIQHSSSRRLLLVMLLATACLVLAIHLYGLTFVPSPRPARSALHPRPRPRPRQREARPHQSDVTATANISTTATPTTPTTTATSTTTASAPNASVTTEKPLDRTKRSSSKSRLEQSGSRSDKVKSMSQKNKLRQDQTPSRPDPSIFRPSQLTSGSRPRQSKTKPDQASSRLDQSKSKPDQPRLKSDQSTLRSRSDQNTLRSRSDPMISRSTSRSGHPPPPCRNAISRLLVGAWEPLPMTERQRNDLYDFDEMVLRYRGIAHGIQRPDGRCGNISSTPSHQWSRALCHPTGPAPCCYHNRCTPRPQDQCTCRECYDIRGLVQTDYATWRPRDGECSFQRWSGAQACSLLSNATVYFIGDSIVRNKYIAFLMALGGKEAAAWSDSMPQDLHKTCRGDGIFVLDTCRRHINFHPDVCQGRVKVKYLARRRAAVVADILEAILQLSNVPRSVVVLGIGISDHFNADLIVAKVLTPVLAKMRSLGPRSPRLVWTSPHTPGIIKLAPRHTRQDDGGVRQFVSRTKAFLQPRAVPYLDSLQLTQGVMSHDGTHFGIAVNRVCAHVLLNHLHEVFSADSQHLP